VKFALFYEIPVARPWDDRSEFRAYRDTLEQAILADKLGFHSVWSVEHHFLDEYSHCSNPEVLYGAIASHTKNIRIGYGVRLMPRPYNHPVRSAESAAVLDLLSDGRVEFGAGRSASRMELEGFGIHPNETRESWQEALEHVVGCWTNDEYEFQGKYWSMPRRRVHPKPLQKPHPPVWGSTGSLDGHRLMGELGIGLLSFSVGEPPEALKQKVDVYRAGIAACTKPIGTEIHDEAASFTMFHVAPTDEEACEVAAESFEWYPRVGGTLFYSVADWLHEMELEAGTYKYMDDIPREVKEGTGGLTFDQLRTTQACVAGDPDTAIEMCKAYETTGCDLLLCLVNPYKIPHEKVMQTIELTAKYVMPEFQ
jgi:alkanesulfonate monooxygenase SsuD/methylene tetrahydromethanopterin reductase-like flavin-dependent oxidoreductase (luciferase family)